jgi:tyrosine-protein kinase
MDIRDFVRTIGRHIWVFVTVFVVLVAVGFAAAFLRADHYESEATIIGVPPNGQADFNSVAAVQFLLPTVVKDVSTVTFRNLVHNSLGPGSSLAGVKIDASLEQGTGILHLTANSKDRTVVTPVANTAANVLVHQKLSPSLVLKILDPAHGPKSTAARLRAPIIVSSLALGLILAIFAALLRDSFDRRLRSSEEITERLGIEILGEIPTLRHFPETPERLFADTQFGRAAEAYQRLVANLEVAFSSGEVRTIAITSAASNEGKTTVTACLAWALALLGHDVLAIDGDLRKPTLHRRLELDGTVGLANATDGNAAALERSTLLPALSVITAGQGPLHPAQIVNNELPEILRSSRERLVLIDTPPLLAASEATLIAMMAKHVILVLDRKARSSDEVERVMNELRRTKTEVLGVVVNRAKIGKMVAGYDDYYVPIPSVKPLRPATRRWRSRTSPRASERTR